MSKTFEWEVEEIINHGQVKEKSQYLVKWKDYEEESNSWDPEEKLLNYPETLKEFLSMGGSPLDGSSVMNHIFDIPDINQTVSVVKEDFSSSLTAILPSSEGLIATSGSI
ncbi:hypothetical protein DSO57_1005766 [Entomophthora muscae]|uniref:Uncharacterized protein n=1 Tax=Entomophthora muscae TaxID=34485 RepID=A0ACC2U6C6_9FUNG|nr:hypothetical protein DSO57_1005766 [Entomophthora muscae]